MTQPFKKQYSDLDTEFYTTAGDVVRLIPFFRQGKALY